MKKSLNKPLYFVVVFFQDPGKTTSRKQELILNIHFTEPLFQCNEVLLDIYIPLSHTFPNHGSGQSHVKEPIKLLHLPLLVHGFSKHSSTSVNEYNRILSNP